MSKYYDKRITDSVKDLTERAKVLEEKIFWVPGNKVNLKKVQTISTKIDKLLSIIDKEKKKFSQMGG